MTEEEKKTYETLVADAQKYVHNVMGLPGEFNKEEFIKYIDEHKDPSIFTNFDMMQRNINVTTLIQGYGNFGRNFIDEVYSKDPDSLKNMFEVITQEYLDLKTAIEEQFKAYAEQLSEKKDAE